MPTKSIKPISYVEKDNIRDPFHYSGLSAVESAPSHQLLLSINDAKQYSHHSRAADANITMYNHRVVGCAKGNCTDRTSSTDRGSGRQCNKLGSILLSPRSHSDRYVSPKEGPDTIGLSSALRKNNGLMTTSRAAYSNLIIVDEDKLLNNDSTSNDVKISPRFSGRSSKPPQTTVPPYGLDCPMTIGKKITTYRSNYSPRYHNGMKGGIGCCRSVLLRNGEHITTKLTSNDTEDSSTTPWEESSMFNISARRCQTISNDSLLNGKTTTTYTGNSNLQLSNVSCTNSVQAPHVNTYICSNSTVSKADLAMEMQQLNELEGLVASTCASEEKTKEAQQLQKEYEVLYNSITTI